MAEVSKVPRVFVSATREDLAEYCQEAGKAILEAGCLPVMQEDFAAGHQPALARCRAEVESCEALVVIVAYRYGWVPPDQEGDPKDKSITWLECLHAEAQKIPVIPFLVDPDHSWLDDRKDSMKLVRAEEEEREKDAADLRLAVRQLKKFKTWLESHRVRARFTSADNLGKEILKALFKWKHPGQEPEPTPEKYIEFLREATRYIELGGLGANTVNQYEIEQLYVPITTAAREDGKDKRIPLEKALTHQRLVIQGDAGSGKTTFLRRIARELVRETGPDVALPIRGLPLFIRISEFDAHIEGCQGRADAPAPQNAAGWIAHFFARGKWDLTERFVEKQLEQGTAILLVDGLDEAPGEDRRERIVRIFQDAVRRFRSAKFFVSTRPGAYQGKAVLSGFETARIEELDDEAVESFLGLWSRAVHPNDAAAAQQRRNALNSALREKSEIFRMARNPVMLTALAVVHWNQRTLPEQRADLYRTILEWLAGRNKEITGKTRLTYLEELAFSMQTDPAGRLRTVEKLGAEKRMKETQPPAGFLDAELTNSGIIVSRGSNLEFWHLTFQEYLAARRLAGLDGYEGNLFPSHGPSPIFQPEWRETMLLLGGVLESQGHGRLNALLRRIADHAEGSFPDEVRCVALLSAMLRDLGPTEFQPDCPQYGPMLAGMRRLFEEGGADEVDIKDRAAAAEALGANHPGLRMPWDSDYWIDVKGGPMGAFQIGRYPVTVWEYGQFLEASQRDAPRDWEDQRRHPARPVVRVTWHDANAYCDWAAKKAKGCRLPDEHQWEFAASGGKRKFAWGNLVPDPSRCNIDGWIGAPSPVGLFPSGNTPEGIADLSGNVWEWTSSRYTPDSKEFVLRGGSWFNFLDFAACAFRSYFFPVIHYNYSGFRCSRT